MNLTLDYKSLRIVLAKAATSVSEMKALITPLLPQNWPVYTHEDKYQSGPQTVSRTWEGTLTIPVSVYDKGRETKLQVKLPRLDDLLQKNGWVRRSDWTGHLLHPKVRQDRPEKAYHVVPESRLQQILKQGILPASSNRKLTKAPMYGDTTGRIYLTNHLEQADELIETFQNDEHRKPEPYSIVEVDLSKVPTRLIPDDKMANYQSNFYISGVKIPPQAVRLLKTVPVRDDPDDEEPRERDLATRLSEGFAMLGGREDLDYEDRD